MLKLNDAAKARVFGVPAADVSREELRAGFAETHPNWTPADVERHLQAALEAGVYVEVEDSDATG